jgi:NAD(P)H-hydrate epimerase
MAAAAAGLELLTAAEMGRCDQAAIRAGARGAALMQNAGAAVAREILKRFKPSPVLVLCGPGNNGGDGFVVARLLAARKFRVRVALLGERAALKGDAAVHATKWKGRVERLAGASVEGVRLAVDAVFGAGLSKPLPAAVEAVFARLAASGAPIVAVDVPSGVHGDTGAALGNAPRCALTVTFCRKKPGHLLLPGRELCGETVLADIGIADEIVAAAGAAAFENAPALWRGAWPKERLDWNKYSRGHAVIMGGAEMTGAARLAARGAMRVGAGFVTLVCPPAPGLKLHYMAALPNAVVREAADARAFESLVVEKRVGAVLVGPGNGLGPETRERAVLALQSGKPCVLDADALSVFEGALPVLRHARRGDCVLTPHDGEYERLFGKRPKERSGSRLDRARDAARETGAVVLLKGYDTVIAHPDGRAAINANAPAYLATAGAGDVLAGMIAGLLAQGMPGFEAAAAAAWLHGAAARAFGAGLIAGDLPDLLPRVLRDLVIS